MNITAHYTSLKPYLFSIAYNMTGQVHEAEDIVQDAFEDVLKTKNDDIQNPRSYLTRMVMNKAIDRLTHLKKQRQEYPALWLPEPYITQPENNAHDILPYVFLHLMEDLNAVERAVFILRESFDYSYEDIAGICDVSVENCRQILHRAKQKLKQPEIANATKKVEANEKILQEFLKACLSHDTTRLSALLKEDVMLYSDGGGKVVAARKILEGISSVGKFLSGIIRKAFDKWSAARNISVNNEPALLMADEEGVYLVLIPYFEQGKVVKIFLMRNPGKIFLNNSVTK
jgi:RNA polymerase sigma-70 factor (ECF subfamily)